MNYQIELRHLQYFQILSEELHFRKAAERLFISQPGLTRQIKQMEEIYGIALFERSKRSVTLTEAGKYLKGEVDTLLSQVENMQRQLKKLSEGKITELRLGFIGSAVQAILPQLLAKIKEQQPLIDITLDELSNETQITLLHKNELDFGFVRIDRTPVGLKTTAILTEHFSLVVPKNHKLLKNITVSFLDFKDEPFILFSKEYSSSYYELVMSIFQDFNFEPYVTLRTVNALSIFNMVAKGLGVAIIPSSLKKGYQADVEFIELTTLPQRTTLSLIWNPANRNPGIPFLLKILEEIKP